MTRVSESGVSDNASSSSETRSGLLKLGAVAVVSAIIGGAAAAWWYRKTISKFHETGENGKNPHFGIEAEDPSDEDGV